ncbi:MULTISPECIES: hypothetical protein [Bacillus]|nr:MULTISPECIES: hypothetical protein [Bacillus]MDU0070050.1 hypothetical protein [Bacillus sp. IG6]MED8017723.1 hypothetical protein [Bacillus glycinifermentans]WKB76114.1 hypothetical protein QYM22_17135 [Bacillus glycinifermentans]
MDKNLIEMLKKQLDIRPGSERQKEHADVLLDGFAAGIKATKKKK